MEAVHHQVARPLAPVHPKRPEPFSARNSFVVPAGMARTQFRAMGTTLSLLFLEEQSQQGTKLVQTLFNEWEQTLSRFLPESELSRLNAHAGRFVLVSPLLYTVLETALIAAEETNGLYDPTLLYQLQQMGYDRTFDALDTQQAANTLPLHKGGAWRAIELDRRLHLAYLPEGVGVDFGGIAKGMAVDAAFARLHTEGVTTALVNAGGDLTVLGTPPYESSWAIEVEGREDREGQESQDGNGIQETRCPRIVPLHHGSMATSGIARRHWRQGTASRHHLIDPRTGEPVQNEMWSVSVVAARCEQAEVAAKVAFLLGSERGSAFLQHQGFAGLMIHKDGTWKTVGSWPQR